MVKRIKTIILYIMYYHIYVRLYEKSACLADVRNENARVRSRGDMRGKMYEKFEFQLREKSIAVIVKPRAIGQTRLHINIYIYDISLTRSRSFYILLYI